MANSRVVNPYMAVVAAVSVACVICPFVVVRGEVNADNAPYWCNHNSINTTDTESTRQVDLVLTYFTELAPVLLRRGAYYTTGLPTPGYCGPASGKDVVHDLINSTGVQTSGFCSRASCNDGMPDSDCTQCVAVAEAALREACKSSIGGQIQLQGCRIRYEAYGFEE